MKLSVINRILILALLPREGNLLTVKILKGLREKLDFSEDEINTYKLTTDGNTYTWDFKADNGVDFIITDGEKGIIKEGLHLLDEQNKLTEQHLPLCELFEIL